MNFYACRKTLEAGVSTHHFCLFSKSKNQHHSSVMDFTGTVVQINPEAGGVGKSGAAWRKQEIIIEIPGQYPKRVCVTVWGDKIDKFALRQGEQVNVSFDLESREYNGRWYTEVKVYNVRKDLAGVAPAPQGGAPRPSGYGAPATPSAPFVGGNQQDDDLPF
jgi:hypothetical protein